MLSFCLRYLYLNGRRQSANYVRTELPIRIAHRLRDLQALPYVVVTREGVAKVYEVGRFSRHSSVRVPDARLGLFSCIGPRLTSEDPMRCVSAI